MADRFSAPQNPLPGEDESPRLPSSPVVFAVTEMPSAQQNVPAAPSGRAPDTKAMFWGAEPPRVPWTIYWFSHSGGRRLVFVLFLALLGAVFLWHVQAILPPFLIAFVLAALLDPTVRAMEKRGRSRVRSILTIYLLGICVVGLLLIVVVPRVIGQIQELAGNLSAYSMTVQTSVNGFLSHHTDQLKIVGVDTTKMTDLLSHRSGPIQGRVFAVLGGVTVVLQEAASRVLWLIIIPVSAFFFMNDYARLRAKLISFFPIKAHRQIDMMSREILEVFSSYLRGLAKICALYSVVAFILFSLLGLNYVLFLAVMAGVLYAVPYVGPLLTAIVTGAVALSVNHPHVLFIIQPKAHSISFAVTVVLCAFITQTIFDQIIYPKVVGASVGLHPVVSIFSLMAGATLFGIWGMLLAVPVAASIQILLMFFFPMITREPPVYLLAEEPHHADKDVEASDPTT